MSLVHVNMQCLKLYKELMIKWVSWFLINLNKYWKQLRFLKL